MTNLEALKKQAIFQAARRAILENEEFLRDYVTNHLPESYGEQDLKDLIAMLIKLFDNDLFDVIMGVKHAEAFEGLYDVRLLKDIELFAVKRRNEIKEKKGLI